MSTQEPEQPNLPGMEPQPIPANYSQEDVNRYLEQVAQGVNASATLKEHMEGISTLTQRFVENFKEFGVLTDSVAKSLESSSNSINQIADGTERATTSQRQSADLSRKQAEHRQKEITQLQKNVQFQKAIQQAEKEMTTATGRRVDKLAQEGKLYDQRTKMFTVPGRDDPVNREQFQQVLSAGTDEEKQAIAQQIALGRSQRQGPIRVQQGFRVQELIQALLGGNFGAAAGELMQQTRGGESLVRRGTEQAAMGGIFNRLGGGSMRLAGMALRPAALLGAQQAFTRINSQVQETRQIGMATGEGFRAGAGARSQAFFQGLNPFDILSGRQAIEMQREARGRGFRGDQANAVVQTVGDVFNRLGTDWKESLDLADESIRRGGMSLGEFKDTMMGLRDTAKETNTSVGELQKSLASFVTERVQAGGTAAGAAAQLTGLEKALGGRAGGRAGAVSAQFLQAAGPMIAVTSGVPPALAATLSPQQVAEAIDKLIKPWVDGKPDGMPWRTWAATVLMFGVPIFQGMNAEDVAIVLKSWAESKGGFAKEIRQQALEGGISRARAREEEV
jgi:hypothetical protein